MGGKAAEQVLVQSGLPLAQGIKSVSARWGPGETGQQLLPEGLGLGCLSEVRRGEGLAFEHQGCQGIWTPGLALQSLLLCCGIVLVLTGQQQAGFAPNDGIWGQSTQHLQRRAGGIGVGLRPSLEQGLATGQGGPGPQAGDGQQLGKAGQWKLAQD